MGVEAFLPEASIERLNEGIIGRLPGTGEVQRNAALMAQTSRSRDGVTVTVHLSHEISTARGPSFARDAVDRTRFFPVCIPTRSSAQPSPDWLRLIRLPCRGLELVHVNISSGTRTFRAARQRERRTFAVASRCNFDCEFRMSACDRAEQPLSGRGMGV